MKLLNRQQIEDLSRFKSEKFLTTSFFLGTDKSRLSKKEILVSAKNLVNLGRTQLESLDLAKEMKASLAVRPGPHLGILRAEHDVQLPGPGDLLRERRRILAGRPSPPRARATGFSSTAIPTSGPCPRSSTGITASGSFSSGAARPAGIPSTWAN